MSPIIRNNMEINKSLLNSQRFSQISQNSIFARSIKFHNHGRPSTQGNDQNMGASSKLSFESLGKARLRTAAERESDSSDKDKFKSDIKPIRMSMFFGNKRESVELSRRKNEEISEKIENKSKNIIEKGPFLMRFRLLNQEKEKLPKDLNECQEKIKKRRIKTAYINNTQVDIKIIENSKNSKNEVVLLKRKFLNHKKNHGKVINKTSNSDFCLDEKFRSQVVEKNWPESVLKEYKMKLKEKIKSMEKELNKMK